MSALKKQQLISVEEYLGGELVSHVKHEYLGGVVYAMAGGRNRHHKIVGNIFGTLYSHLLGQTCQPCNSDTKIRIELPNQTRFYYPDVSVVCEPNPEEDVYQDAPVIIVEVISRATSRIDTHEKLDAYTTIPSLECYILVEQAWTRVVVYRRTAEGFLREVYEGINAVVPLPAIQKELRLSDVYRNVRSVRE